MAIPHSLDAVIEAVQAIIDNRPIPEDWKAHPAPEVQDFSGVLFGILNKAEEVKMDVSEFEALPRDDKQKILAERLAALSTKQQSLDPIQKAIASLGDEIKLVSERVAMIEAAILSAKGPA